MSDSLLTIALKDLKSDRCACGRPKKSAESFCKGCYFSLTPAMRRSLYATVSEGYASNYDSAKTYLQAETDRFINVAKEED